MLEFYLLKTYLALLHWQIILEYAQVKQLSANDESCRDEPSTAWQSLLKG
jgi:hypothetical protein